MHNARQNSTLETFDWFFRENSYVIISSYPVQCCMQSIQRKHYPLIVLKLCRKRSSKPPQPNRYRLELTTVTIIYVFPISNKKNNNKYLMLLCAVNLERLIKMA